MKKISSMSVFKAVIVLAAGGMLLWLAVQYFSVFGGLSLSYDFQRESAFVSEWYPKGRALDREQNLKNGDAYQRIVGEPVYINVVVPRSYDRVHATVEYTNPEQPLLEFGVVTSEDPFAVRLQPFQSTVIDQALAEWDVLKDEETGLTLLQREQRYDSVASFIEQPPTDQHVATYQYALHAKYIDESYTSETTPLVIDPYLRGPHRFATYAENEDLDMTLTFVDMNIDFNQDPVLVEVLHDGALIHEATLDDDGDSEATINIWAPGERLVTVPMVEPGMYEYRVNSTNDMVITHIESFQHHFVVVGSLLTVNSAEYAHAFPLLTPSPTIIFTQATQLSARTSHTGSVQALSIDAEKLNVAEVDTPFWWTAQDSANDTQIRQITIPANDVQLQRRGVSAFNEASLFNPNYFIQPLDDNTSIENLDAILFHDYTPPVLDKNTYTQTTTLELDGVAGDRKELSFVLSAPGIDREQYEIAVNKISFQFEREPLWKRIQQRFQ